MTSFLRSPSQIVNPLDRRRFIGFGSGTGGGGGGFVGPLDDYTANLSVMLLPFRGLSSYTGNAFRVRDTTGDAEQNIGFDPVTGDLAAFTVGGNAAVRWWYDQSGGARDVPQATAAAQPFLTTNIVNGQPVARFDGTNDFLRGDCPNELGRTIYMVARMRSSVANVRLSNDSLNGNASTYNTGSASYNYYSTAPNVVDPVGGTSTNWSMIALKYSGGNTLAPYVNNTAATPFSTTAFYTTGTAYWLGSDQGGAGSFGPLDLAARLQYDVAHDNTTRQAIQTILAAKFGITLA
jgi:hypothetical protein